VLFLTGCVSSEPASTPQEGPDPAELEALREENKALLDSLEQMRAQASTVRRGETIEILSTDVYFESGSAQLTPEGVEKLKNVAQRIKTQYAGRPIRVEGYTDDKPIGDRLKQTYPSNWELSAARAAAVVRHLQWTHKIDPVRFEVVGFGPYQPIATNETAEGRRENRRVRIAVLPSEESTRAPASPMRRPPQGGQP
jgi:chemotaxis protein MotB